MTESSHRYPQVEFFINEVYRVLKPGGTFLLTDFGQSEELKMLKKHIKNAQFEIVKEENITNEVIDALRLSTPERKVLINKIIPAFLKGVAYQFAATEGSTTL
ncbi:MAG: hypothetical protein B6I20_03730 [Bacteroidetes bacterium 4572_117]|nr:MAG: hypothetical protein B6I20_03730 [Bacteroidetes bacterium 4572_117]